MRCRPGCQLEIPAPSEHPPEQADNRSQLPVAALGVAIRERYDLDLDHECVGRAADLRGRSAPRRDPAPRRRTPRSHPRRDRPRARGDGDRLRGSGSGRPPCESRRRSRPAPQRLPPHPGMPCRRTAPPPRPAPRSTRVPGGKLRLELPPALTADEAVEQCDGAVRGDRGRRIRVHHPYRARRGESGPLTHCRRCRNRSLPPPTLPRAACLKRLRAIGAIPTYEDG